uniref:Daxx histone-binding domain-containing protein n=1 Tax=Heliothis virescens TaxID=7102 RepID=A0A2A4JCZ4_HELVI
MNTETVIIEDDDVEMVPIVVLDEDDDKVSTEKAPSPRIVETIDLDDEQPSEAPTMDYKTEQAFVRKLEINRLMDKIVTMCINMENAVGMSRVIHKTLLPLYRDTSNTVKESEEFKKLLKKTWKLLVKDPNHKFLHIKTLCEELKSGRLRRKVPFVTLSTELPHLKTGFVTELHSSSRQLNSDSIKSTNVENNREEQQNRENRESSSDSEVECVDMNEIGKRRSERIKKSIKKKKKIGAAMKRKLTNSPSSAKLYQQRKRYANMANKRKLNRIHLANSAKLHKLRKQCAAVMKRKLTGSNIARPHRSETGYEKTDIITLDNSDNEPEDSQTNHENQNVNIMLGEAYEDLNVDTEKKIGLDEDSNKENDQSENNLTKLTNVDMNELLVPQNYVEVRIDNVVPYEPNAEMIKAIENNASKLFNEDMNELLVPQNHVELRIDNVVPYDPNAEMIKAFENNVSTLSNEDMNELLVPQNHVEVTIDNEVPYDPKAEMIKAIEEDIAFYKKRIAELEEAEVTSDSILSPYIQCAKLKRRIIASYKEICKIKGNSDDIVKRREIRLHVANGHPAGPAKRLEEHLNDSIDNTGAVAFPDFSDVVKCVIEANREDCLGWCRQRVFQEASVLFRKCGQALRKRRQKREYRDLLSLVRDKQEPDDPAENNPELLAKLEENKLIAKIKEEEILERYVNMENQTYSSRAETNGEASMLELQLDRDSSDSDNDDENNTTTPADVAPDINNQHVFEDCPQTYSFESVFEAFVSSSSPTITSSNREEIAISNQVNIANVSNDYNVNISVNANPSAYNPLLTQLLGTPFVLPQCSIADTAGSQNILRESSSVNDDQARVPPIVVPDTYQDKSIKTEEIIDTNLDTVTTTDYSNSFTKIKIEDRSNSISDRIQFCDEDKVKIEDVTVKKEPEPVDVQSMLDELGDSFVCTVFDFEDPFLVIEISSDGFSEEEL